MKPSEDCTAMFKKDIPTIESKERSKRPKVVWRKETIVILSAFSGTYGHLRISETPSYFHVMEVSDEHVRLHIFVLPKPCLFSSCLFPSFFVESMDSSGGSLQTLSCLTFLPFIFYYRIYLDLQSRLLSSLRAGGTHV
jgi:hypothetical protein